MGERPKDLPPLTLERLGEIRALLYYESSIEFSSGRAHEAMWMLVEAAEELLMSRSVRSRQPPTPASDPMYFEDDAPGWWRHWMQRGRGRLHEDVLRGGEGQGGRLEE